jgi:alpha-amylase
MIDGVLCARGDTRLLSLMSVAVVYNHMGPQSGGDGDFSVYAQFNRPEYFHPLCQIVDWNNQTQVELCRLGEHLSFALFDYHLVLNSCSRPAGS